MNHCVRAGHPASTTVTKRAPQGRARRPDASSKGGVRTIPKEPLPQKDFCSSGVLESFRETISESQGDLSGTEGWTKTSLLGGMCPSRQQLVFDLCPWCCPTCSGADGRCHPGEESGAARRAQGISRHSVEAWGGSEWCLVQ